MNDDSIPPIAETVVTSTPESRSEDKIFAVNKIDMGIAQINGKLVYGAHLVGVVTGKEKSAFSILSTPKDSVDDISVDTFLFVDEYNDEVMLNQITDSKEFKWFFGKETDPGITMSLSDSVRKVVIKDVNKWKGMYKESNIYKGISRETADLIFTTLTTLGKADEMFTYNSQLQKELQKEILNSQGVSLGEFVKRYAFKEHILLSGKAGTTKTYTADKYIDTLGCHKEFVAGHAGLESTDLLGYPIRHVDGNFIWMDGPLTAAFRKAQTEKTALFIDELLRIPAKELNILVGSLTPNSANQFVLRTNRLVDVKGDVGKSETLIVPVENLWVIATTNLGSNYNVEEMDVALNDRFITHDVTIEDATVKQIIENNNPHKHSKTALSKSFKAFQAINALVKAQELSYDINVRHITKVIKNAETDEALKSYFFDMAPNIVSRTTEGTLNTVELKIYKDVIKSIF